MNISELRNLITTSLVDLHVMKTYVEKADLNLQPILRMYVANRYIPLDERFECWSFHCKKKYMGDIDGQAEGTLIERMVYDDCPECFEDRGRDYDWEFFIDRFKEDEEESDPRLRANYLQGYGMTFDDFREFLIAENFGYFTWDW